MFEPGGMVALLPRLRTAIDRHSPGREEALITRLAIGIAAAAMIATRRVPRT